MTTKELNRDIKRLAKKAIAYSNNNNVDDVIRTQITNEISRLYMADPVFKYMNKTSVLVLLSLNLTYRVFNLHTFGVSVELTELV